MVLLSDCFALLLFFAQQGVLEDNLKQTLKAVDPWFAKLIPSSQDYTVRPYLKV